MRGRSFPRARRAAAIAAAAAAEVLIYVSYRGHDARFHWFTHFFVGPSAALVVMSALAARWRRAVRYPLLWPVFGHVVAMFPDLLFVAGEAHERWMDVVLGHISTHFVPGRNTTWYLFLVALALYLVVLDSLRTAAGAESGSTEPNAQRVTEVLGSGRRSDRG